MDTLICQYAISTAQDSFNGLTFPLNEVDSQTKLCPELLACLGFDLNDLTLDHMKSHNISIDSLSEEVRSKITGLKNVLQMRINDLVDEKGRLLGGAPDIYPGLFAIGLGLPPPSHDLTFPIGTKNDGDPVTCLLKILSGDSKFGNLHALLEYAALLFPLERGH